MDETLRPFVPVFEYLLNDLSDYSEEDLLKMDGSWVKRAFLALKATRNRKSSEGVRIVFHGLHEREVNELLSNFIDLVFVYLLQSGMPKEIIMRAIEKVDSPAKEKVLTAYDQILREGMEKGKEKWLEVGMQKGRTEERMRKNFQVFKKGIPLGLSLASLMELTEVDEKTAKTWTKLLKANPEADLLKE